MVRRVEELAELDGIDEMVNGEPLFEWEPGNPITNMPNEITIEPVDVLPESGNMGHNAVIFDDIE